MDTPANMSVPNHEFRLVFGRSRIDYDANKEAANRRKHHYSLESGVDLLQRLLLPIGDHRPYAVSDPFAEGGEVRHMHLGVDDYGVAVLMVTTMREDETVRVISFRRAHEDERELFRGLTGYV